MDFHLSKENIQPLSGGRNAEQLEVALQAEHNPEMQKELQQIKEYYENGIRNYVGPDPLQNYYQYIAWVEQTYPKHEGRLLELLEDCIVKFENDKAYQNDKRFCKLWIKYIDMQKNNVELYQMLYSKGICVGCADLYKAWAFYHQMAGDYSSADYVFKLGIKVLAQPYDELIEAHKQMIFNAGIQSINGVVDNSNLAEQRQALTALNTYKPGHVGSIRNPTASGPGVWHSMAQNERPNAQLSVPEDQSTVPFGIGAPPTSVLSAVIRDAPKENIMKAGKWTCAKSGTSTAHKTSSIQIHEDASVPPHLLGIRLPINHSKQTLEDFSNWRTNICNPEPEDPSKIPQYPKSKVYIDASTEYSMEELRAKRYRGCANATIVACESMDRSLDNSVMPVITNEGITSNLHYHNSPPILQPQIQQIDYDRQLLGACSKNDSPLVHTYSAVEPKINFIKPYESGMEKPLTSFLQRTLQQPPRLTAACETQDTNTLDLWKTAKDESSVVMPKPAMPTFKIFDESFTQPVIGDLCQPGGSAMKTPFKALNADDIAETGSRGGLETAAAAQPTDGAVFDVDDSMYYNYKSDMNGKTAENFQLNAINTSPPILKKIVVPYTDDNNMSYNYNNDFNATNTEIFQLNAIHVSTPNNKRQTNVGAGNVDASSTKKKLFETQPSPDLSTINEEKSNDCANSNQSYQRIMTPATFRTPSQQATYDSNLLQNMKANAELRSKLGIDCESTIEYDEFCNAPSVEVSREDAVYTPYPVLDIKTSDPFRPKVTEQLLRHVGFPGRHIKGYNVVNSLPKLSIRKEPFHIGNDRYLMEKLLGRGTFASVYKAVKWDTKEVFAMKVQKPPNRWEFYICREIRSRLVDHPLRDRFMDVTKAYFCESTSALVSELCSRSLLDLFNGLKQKLTNGPKQNLAIHITMEMIKIVQALHSVKIIHADIKPDNFLILLRNDELQLQLIDFGCSIDMSLYPEGTHFTRVIATETFTCCEMKDGRPWNYHTDIFCIAATTHVLLLDSYMDLKKVEGGWRITKKIPRYFCEDFWSQYFWCMLNMQEELPNFNNVLPFMQAALEEKDLKIALREVYMFVKQC